MGDLLHLAWRLNLASNGQLRLYVGGSLVTFRDVTITKLSNTLFSMVDSSTTGISTFLRISSEQGSRVARSGSI